MWVAFANAKATHIFFSKNISVYAIFDDQNFNDTLTNDIVSFEQLGPGQTQMRQRSTKPTNWHVRPAKTQNNLSIRSDWSESLLGV